MNREALRLFTAIIALLFISEGILGFPLSWIMHNEFAVNSIFLVIFTLCYTICGFCLAKRRFTESDRFNLPIRGEILLHCATLFLLISGLALLQASAEDPADLRITRFVVFGCGGFLSIAWLSLAGITLYGPEAERAKLDALLRGSTFTKS